MYHNINLKVIAFRRCLGSVTVYVYERERALVGLVGPSHFKASGANNDAEVEGWSVPNMELCFIWSLQPRCYEANVVSVVN